MNKWYNEYMIEWMNVWYPEIAWKYDDKNKKVILDWLYAWRIRWMDYMNGGLDVWFIWFQEGLMEWMNELNMWINEIKLVVS